MAMTFLELCSALSRESGTVAAYTTKPSAVTGQTGREGKIVDWIKTGWIDIQNMHPSWNFRRIDFNSASLIASTGAYTAASLSLSNVQRFIGNRSERDTFTIYDPSTGVSDEKPLYWMDWQSFRRKYQRGTQTDSRPVDYSISPDGQFHVGPKPDKVYTLTGEYIRTPQELAANTDEPLCDDAFHMGIVWYALGYLVEHDEAPLEVRAGAERKWQSMYRAMCREHLPTMTAAGSALA